MNYNSEVLDKKIVFFSPKEPFTWASGIKSPIYCDNRLILAYPEFRNYVEDELSNLIQKQYIEVDIIMGTATAGIPHSALIAQRLNLACGYVRGSVKKHGRSNQIEGISDVRGKKIVVIEDLISTGSSVIEAVEVLQEAGAEVLGVVAIFTYNLEAGFQNFKNKNIKFSTLSDINQLISYAQENNILKEDEVDLVNSFLEDPQTWYEREFNE